jgi:hypothetical protein
MSGSIVGRDRVVGTTYGMTLTRPRDRRPRFLVDLEFIYEESSTANGAGWGKEIAL